MRSNHIFASYPSKLELMPTLSNKMSDYMFKAPKKGGANNPGRYGGIYETNYRVMENEQPVEKSQAILFKQDTRSNGAIAHEKNIAEFVSGRIMNALIGDSSASIFLAIAPDASAQIPDDTGENIYVGSIFYDNYEDLFKDIYKRSLLHHEDVPEERPRGFGILPERTKILNDAMLGDDNKCKYKDFEKVTIASILVKDFDIHPGNYGVVSEQGKPVRLVKIDHGAALDELSDDLHVHSSSEHLPIKREGFSLVMQPTNHVLDYDRSLRVSPEFSAELDREATINLDDTINNAIDEVTKYYGPRPLAVFAKRAGVKIDDLIDNVDWDTLDTVAKDALKKSIADRTKLYLRYKMHIRQQSCTQLSTDIKLSLAIRRKSGILDFELDNEKIRQIILEDPSYFLRGKYHFRGKDQRSWLRHLNVNLHHSTLENMVINVLDDYIDAIAQNAVTKSDPKIIESILSNKRLMKKIKKNPQALSKLKADYQQILHNISRDLIAHSRQLFVNLTEPENSKTGDNLPQSHRDIINAANNLSNRVAIDILTERSVTLRTLALERWIAIMNQAMKNRDCHTAYTIYSVLNSKDILRLSTTFSGLSINAKNILKEFDRLYKTYKDNNDRVGVVTAVKSVELTKRLVDNSEPFIPTLSAMKMLTATFESNISSMDMSFGKTVDKSNMEKYTKKVEGHKKAFTDKIADHQQKQRALLDPHPCSYITYEELTKAPERRLDDAMALYMSEDLEPEHHHPHPTRLFRDTRLTDFISSPRESGNVVIELEKTLLQTQPAANKKPEEDNLKALDDLLQSILRTLIEINGKLDVIIDHLEKKQQVHPEKLFAQSPSQPPLTKLPTIDDDDDLFKRTT